MFLSLGALSFTISSSMYNSPDVISSSPAIILNVVDLPHPEGPTNTINSLSLIDKLKSKTACTPFGYILLISFNCNVAIKTPYLIYYNYNLMNAFTQCATCTNRFKQINGTSKIHL